METIGKKFTPLNIPRRICFQTAAAAAFVCIGIYGVPTSIMLTAYLILYTKWRWIMILYLIWIWGIDRKTPERGGRRWHFMCHGNFYRYFKDYFPANLERLSGVEFDPKRNYLFCAFPHGVLPVGVIAAFGNDFYHVFTNHTFHFLTLSASFYIPFFRELVLAAGACAISEKSINYFSSASRPGKIVLASFGGVAEALLCRPGEYNFYLRNRKGFVRLAIKNGIPLVPVISFGESDVYNQVVGRDGSLFQKIQQAVKKFTGIAPVVPLGRGILPRRVPITNLVGRPIEVEKVENPTQEQIDCLHERFVKELTELFEENKHKYIRNSENVKLNIV